MKGTFRWNHAASGKCHKCMRFLQSLIKREVSSALGEGHINSYFSDTHLSTGRPDLCAYNGDIIWRWCIVIDVTDILDSVYRLTLKKHIISENGFISFF